MATEEHKKKHHVHQTSQQQDALSAPELPDELKPEEAQQPEIAESKVEEVPMVEDANLDQAEGDEKPDTETGLSDEAGPEADNSTPEITIAPSPTAIVGNVKPHGVFKRFWYWTTHHKKLSIPLLLVIAIAALASVPWTRFAIAGTFWKQNEEVMVMDSQTHKPISSVQVKLDGMTTKTNSQGRAMIHVRVGSTTLAASKLYYTTATQKVVVPILKPKHVVNVYLRATGRQVPIAVANKITGKPLANATIKAADTEVKTDKQGNAIIVLPADKTSVKATLTANGYNNSTATITITTQTVPANKFQLTPSGKLYFLSNLSGKIDVVKTNLDGTDRQTVLAGTGNEDTHDTVLLASRDWKYLALLSKRDANQGAKLYMIDTSNDALTTMDEGNATFTPVGWSNDRFVYQVYRTDVPNWQPKQTALKSFNAPTQKIVTLDETTASGTDVNHQMYQNFTSAYILPDSEVVYGASWYGTGYTMPLAAQAATLNSVKDDGTAKHVVKSFTLADTTAIGYSVAVQLQSYEPDGLYVLFNDGKNPDHFYEYDNGQLKDAPASVTDSTYYNSNYATYLFSPDGTQTFWTEPQDGKNSLLIGDTDADNSKKIASLSDYSAYGWYGNDYLLVSKNSSELYIMPVAGGQATKITDYYKPAVSFNGYGSGYGGL